MFIKIDENLINTDKVAAIVADEIDGEFVLIVQFEYGSELTIFYDTEKEAVNELNKIYQHFI